MPKKKKAQPQKSNPDPFLMAARCGDIKTINKLLKAGIDPDICHPTPAPTSNEVGAFQHVSSDEQEADPSWGRGNEHFGWTALHLAARQGYVEIVGQLVDAGADVNALSRYDETPLHRALWYSETKTAEEVQEMQEIARLLIKAGADLNAIDRANQTPLLPMLFSKDCLPIVEMLVSAGADIHAQGALHLAIEENKPKVVKVLLASQKVHFKRKRKRKTPLELAKSLNRTTIIRLLESAEKKGQGA